MSGGSRRRAKGIRSCLVKSTDLQVLAEERVPNADDSNACRTFRDSQQLVSDCVDAKMIRVRRPKLLRSKA